MMNSRNFLVGDAGNFKIRNEQTIKIYKKLTKIKNLIKFDNLKNHCKKNVKIT